MDAVPKETDRSSTDDSPPPPAEPPRRSGPLIVERHRKADGRLLILYFRDEAMGAAATDG